MASDLVRDILEDIRSPLYMNALLLIINTALIAGAGFLFWVVAANLYTEEELGLALVLVSVASFLAAISQLGFGTGIIRFLPGTKNDKGKLINSCLTIGTLVSIAISVIVLTFIEVWLPQGRELIRFWILVPIFLALVPMTVNSPIVDNSFVAGRRALFVLVRNGVFQSVRLVMPFILVGVLGLMGILGSLVVAHAAALSLSFFILLPRMFPGFRPGPAIDKVVINDILHFSLGNHVAEVLQVLPQPVILVIVTHVTGRVDQAAFFGVPWLIASMLFAIPLMASVSLFAEGSHFEDRLYGDFRRTMRFMAPLLALGILLVWFLGDWILSLFGPRFAAEGFALLRILAVSALFVAANGLFIAVARVKKWVKAIIAFVAYITLTTIGLSYWLIPTFGLEGTGIAWLTANGTAALAVVGIILAKRRTLKVLIERRT